MNKLFGDKLLIVILILAALLRLWGLAYNPPHLSSDEAALGYNAYSILKTGRDEHGEFLPIIFKSFGDWKPGLYVYLTIPFVAALGLTELAVRLPAAISGVVAILLVCLVAQRLFDNKRVGTLAAFFLAASPWHLQFTRGAWEAGVSLTLILAGVYFFLQAVDKKPRALILSAVFFALTLWTYQGAKLSTLIVIAILFLLFRERIFATPRRVFGAMFLGLIVAIPVVLSLAQGKVGRLEVYSIFSYRRPPEIVQEIVDQDNATVNSWQYFLYHSEPLNFARGILGRWTNHYSGRFLFFDGDWANPRHASPNVGVLLLSDIVLLILGFVSLARAKYSQAMLFVALWFVLAPLPAALSRDSVHAVRSLNLVVPLSIVIALGVEKLLRNTSKKIVVVFAIIYVANYLYYLDAYWVHAPKKNSQSWQYGYEQMVEKVSGLQTKYSEIVIKQDYTQPYIFFLFYQRYDPAKYQKIAQSVYVPSQYGDVGLVSKLDNIKFREINWSADQGASGKLFVVDPIKVPTQDSSDPTRFKLVDEIRFLNGDVGLRFIEIL